MRFSCLAGMQLPSPDAHCARDTWLILLIHVACVLKCNYPNQMHTMLETLVDLAYACYLCAEVQLPIPDAHYARDTCLCLLAQVLCVHVAILGK